MSKGDVSAAVALADGYVLRGKSFGAQGLSVGEVVFNTSMTGYQEILTDPSYAYQILTFCTPHIGNVGVNDEDFESDRPYASGVIVRDYSTAVSNFRAKRSLAEFLQQFGVVGLSGVDTRSLVLHLRSSGSQMGVLASGDFSDEELVRQAREAAVLDGQDLVKDVTTRNAYKWLEGGWQPEGGYRKYTAAELESRPLVVAIDYGVKRNILRMLTDVGFQVEVVPASYSAAQIAELKPAGVFLSNGPGDPAAVDYGVQTVRDLLGRFPLFGICFGHQLLGLALGMKTYKLKFGHRGGNHPVRDERYGKVDITVQNHGFGVQREGLPRGVEITQVNLNDGSVAGLYSDSLRALSVQYHPECSPGPQDAQHLFQEFYNMVEGKNQGTTLKAAMGA